MKVLVLLTLCLQLASFTMDLHDSSKIDEAQQEETQQLKKVLNIYHQGFIEEDYVAIRSQIADQYSMLNGNFSGEPIDWQPHQFLYGNEIDEWIKWMLENIRPFTNEIEFKSISHRNNSAIIVTNETGTNGFRKWNKEEVTYYLGKIENEWKLVGFFMKNMKNPD